MFELVFYVHQKTNKKCKNAKLYKLDADGKKVFWPD